MFFLSNLFLFVSVLFLFSCTSKNSIGENSDVDALNPDFETVDIDESSNEADNIYEEIQDEYDSIDEEEDFYEVPDKVLEDPDESESGKPCSDIGCKGFPDIVFANTDNGTTTNINSFVYLGSKEGYSVENRIDIPTIGAMGIDFADVNNDGYLDIAFASVKEKKEGEEENRFSVSLLYYGTAEGFDLENRVEFPTVGCSDITLVDLDQDGWIDVITPNRYNGSGMMGDGYKINSYIYWGSENGFDINNKLELPTVGAAKARVADLNGNGINDIVFVNGVQEYVGVFESYIYWGTENSKNGWNFANRTTLPSVSPETATIADINDDGFPDIFISGWLCLTRCSLKNRIYWGGAEGFNKNNYTKIDGVDGITDAIFIDLNGNGLKDIVMASGAVDLKTQEFSKTSFILWGSPDPGFDKYSWSDDNVTELPATAASEAGVADLNGDGYLDVVFSSHYPPEDEAQEVSQIYWGSPDGFDPQNVTELPTFHAAGMKIIGRYNKN
jgi:hypothetical protein